MNKTAKIAGIAITLWGLSGCINHSDTSDAPPQINPQNWPQVTSPLTRDPAMEADISALLSRMTLEEKVGQVIQADIASVTPEQVKAYHLGSILNGGNSAPGGDNRTAAKNWLSLADEFWRASTDTSDGGVGIPALWGIDAVHGHNNIVGATIFPHNIGLGAANDPLLMKRIGQVTATEIRVTGIDWTFAPTLAVVRNDKWGRTYESYSESPKVVANYAAPLVEGIQGRVNTPDFLSAQHIIATAKHFVGDGGTVDGKDQGDTRTSEAELRDIHAAGYPAAIAAGAQTVMASFNSWHGRKMHGYKAMLTDVLVERMGFDGFVVGDWNGHGQVAGCSNASCAQAFNAGLDMFMAPDSWQELYENTLAQVRRGEISTARLDQAVARILRVKMRAGLFDAGLPSSRPLAGQFDLLGAPQHRAVAREAVRKSLVLLKNDNKLLPLMPNLRVLVAGQAGDDIGQQSGGWTLSWQGTGNQNSDFPNGQSIYAGIAEHVTRSGGQAKFSADGGFDERPDVAIVVFGEEPYAEFQGDRGHLDYPSEDGVRLLRHFQALGIPTVSVFLSGRPLWVNPELNLSDAFIAAWLPGSEGGGIADLLFRSAQGKMRYDFTGRLTFSWPRLPGQAELNRGDVGYHPLFAFGYGLSVNDDYALGQLSESVDVSIAAAHERNFLFAGDPVVPWRLVLEDDMGSTQVTGNAQTSSSGALITRPQDDRSQEDTLVAQWQGQATLLIEGNPVDMQQPLADNFALQVEYKVLSAPESPVFWGMGCEQSCAAPLDVTRVMTRKASLDWQKATLPLSCFIQHDEFAKRVIKPLIITAGKGFAIQLREVILTEAGQQAGCAF